MYSISKDFQGLPSTFYFVHGILTVYSFSSQNAAYGASKKGFSVTDIVATALSNATFDKQPTQQVLIQSDDSAVLSKFSNVATYKRVLLIEEKVSQVPKATIDEIKKFANVVNLHKTHFYIVFSLLNILYSFRLSNYYIQPALAV